MVIDAVEAAGLRAFALQVCSAAGEPEPKTITHRDQDDPVLRVIARWGEVERIGFRVVLESGSIWLVYYVPELDLWSGIAMTPHEGSDVA